MVSIDPPKPSTFSSTSIPTDSRPSKAFTPLRSRSSFQEVVGPARSEMGRIFKKAASAEWLKSSCSSLVLESTPGSLDSTPGSRWSNHVLPKMVVKLLFFSHDDKFPTQIMVLSETKLYEHGGQGLPGFTVSDRPKNCWMSYHVLTESLYYQPKHCPIMKGIPKITIHLHCLILPKWDNLMIPA